MNFVAGKMLKNWSSHIQMLAGLVTIIYAVWPAVGNYLNPVNALEATGKVDTVDVRSLPLFQRQQAREGAKRAGIEVGQPSPLYSYFRIALKNTGKAEANDIVLKLPGEAAQNVVGVAVNEQPVAFDQASREVRLGDLKPAITTVVAIWAKHGIASSVSQMVISHRNGSAQLEMVQSITAKDARRFDRLQIVVYILGGLAVLVFVLLVVGLVFNHTGPKETEKAC